MPLVLTDKVKRAIPLIAQVYARSVTGGGLHVELDDWNLDDEIVMRDRTGELYGPETLVEVALAQLLAEMTVEERGSAVARHFCYDIEYSMPPASVWRFLSGKVIADALNRSTDATVE